MTKYILCFFLLFTFTLTLIGQTHIAGFIKDKNTGEVLVGAYIVEIDANNVAISDNHGYFSLIIHKSDSLKISFVGFNTTSVYINTKHDSLITVYMEGCTELEDVIIKAQRVPLFNASTVSYDEMMQTPSLGSKPDIMKSLQLQPGIQTQNEGSSLLQVRGGNPGENLYLLDNIPLIYVNHLGGFMSVFNPDMINNVTIYKGGFPSCFGSKLSSVVDITQREGNNSELKGSYSIGVTDASFTLEGPLKPKNTTFIITGRKTFTDLLLAAASKLADGAYIISYGFHDLNGKLTWKPNDKNNLHINLYQGDDYLNFWSKTETEITTEKSHVGNTWGNWMASADWNHVVSPRLFFSTSFSYTRYRLKDLNCSSTKGVISESETKIKYLSSVQDISLRSGWRLKLLKNWNLNYGLQASFLIHNPNKTYRSNATTVNNNSITALESAIYLENKISFNRNSEASVGLRAISYLTNGYSANNLEPRLNLTIGISENQLLNFSYMKVNQYSHLIFTSETFLNNEVWIPADKTIPQSWSQQINASWNCYFWKQMFQFGLALYFKELRNLATYKEGYTSLMGDVNWRKKVDTNGKGTSYGVELFLKKNYGKWNGFINYSYSKSTRRYPNINNGNEYLFEYDRPNCASIGISHKFIDNLTLNVIWIYQTGLPYTPAEGLQYTPDLEQIVDGHPLYYKALIYGKRNSERMKDYHRLDLSLQYSRITKKRRLYSTWSFSIYNVYNRKNPYYYYYNANSTSEMYYPYPGNENESLKLYQICFFPIMPSLSYKVFFDKGSWNHEKNKIQHYGVYDIRKRLTIKLGYAFYPYKIKPQIENNPFGTITIKADINYGITKNMEAGAYLGYGYFYEQGMLFTQSHQMYPHRVLYGININYQILPYIVKREDFRFDLYLTGNCGGVYYIVPDNINISNYLKYDYGLYGGLSFYIFKHIGLFIEYGYGNMTNLRYGLAFKFKH